VVTSYSVDNDRRFRNALARAKAEASDFSTPLEVVGKDFFKTQGPAFASSGASRYPDLSPGYKAQKKSRWGFIYPILKASGLLEKSMTDPNDPNAVAEVIGGETLILGTKVPYAPFLNASRPFIFIGPEKPRQASSEQMARPDRWARILNVHVLGKLVDAGVGEVP
jgi:hypothetical protein